MIQVEKMLMVKFYDNLDMRKALKRDPEGILSKPTGKRI